MTLESVLAQLDVMLKAPGGVAKVREMILGLAMNGSLVPFNVESSARPLKELLSEESRNGLSTRPQEEAVGTPILRISACTSRADAVIDETDVKYVKLTDEEVVKYALQPNDLLACRFNGNLHYVGRMAVYEGNLGATQVYPDKLIRFRIQQSVADARFVRHAFNAQSTRRAIERHCATTAGNIGISATNLKEIRIPVPALEAQRRIVAKVDELMALCEALEHQLSVRDLLRKAALRSKARQLVFATDSRSSGSGMLDLVASADDIPIVRHAVLDLAVHGRLAKSLALPTRDITRTVLPPIARGSSAASTRRERTAGDQSTNNERPAWIPDHWLWLTVEECSEIIVDCPHSTPKFVTSGFACVDTTCIRPGGLKWDRIRYVDEQTFNERTRRLPPRGGDIVFAREATVGTAVALPDHPVFCLGQRVLLIRPSELLTSKYMELALQAPATRHQYAPRLLGSTVPHLNVSDVRKLRIPVPHVSEQREIVSAVEGLVSHCDLLEQRLVQRDEGARRLLSAVLRMISEK